MPRPAFGAAGGAAYLGDRGRLLRIDNVSGERQLVARYYASLRDHPNPRPANITDFSEH